MTITCTLLNDKQRIDYPAALFGYQFGMRIEPTIYSMADRLSDDYRGGFWQFYSLSNGGFLMTPESPEPFRVVSMNGYECVLPAHAFGLTCCMYAFSNLSFVGDSLQSIVTEQYHYLRDYLFELPEARQILAVID